MRKIMMVLMIVVGIGSAAFAGTYKNYEETCKHIWGETSITFCADLSKYRSCQFEVTDDLWGGFGRKQEKLMKDYIQTSPNFNGVVTMSTLVNGTDKTMWCFMYKNGKHYKTIVWTFFVPETTEGVK